MSVEQGEVLRLRLERRIPAERERVFEAWTRPELLRLWSAPEGMTVGEGEVDLRPGGRWRVVMLGEDGARHEAFGTYREVSPPERLVYTHAWVRDDLPSGSSPETVLTVEFREEDGGTRVVLTQEGFESAGSRDGHVEGWSSCLNRLERIFDDGEGA